MNQEFYVLKDETGKYRPMAFITAIDEHGTGEVRKESYEKKMEEGEKIVRVQITEIK